MLRFVLAMTFLAAAVPAHAQQADTLPLFVVDARGLIVPLKDDAATSTSLGITSLDLPGHGLGFVGGAQLYPLRGRRIAFGVGGEFLLASGRRQNTDEAGNVAGPEMHRLLQSMSVQVSLNFGHRLDWGYLTVGAGPIRYDTYRDGSTPDGPRRVSTNFGVGARWFTTQHAAFTLDLRFYATPPAMGTAVVGARLSQSLVVVSAGIGIR
jgi:hypothetical protein